MKRFIDHKIGTKLIVLLGITLIILFSALGLFITYQQKAKILSDTDIRMSEQVSDLNKIISLQINNNTKDIVKTRHLAEIISQQYVQQNAKTTLSEIDLLSQDHQFVDEVAALTNHAIISIFKTTDEGFERTSSSLIIDHKRNIGTLISNTSEISQALKASKTFTGRSHILKNWFISSYSPFIKNDEVIGAIGVAIRNNFV